MKIFKFIYNPNTFESAYITQSLHKTIEGAIKAMNEHKNLFIEDLNQMLINEEDKDISIYLLYHDWDIEEIEILD